METSWFNGHSKKTVVFTDGSCYPNKKIPSAKGGFAANFVQGPFKDITIYGSLDNTRDFATNIRAEGMAIIETLKYLQDHINEWTECVIISDCEFWINMINKYMPKWKPEKFASMANSDMTTQMWELWSNIMLTKELTLYHVRSHNKNGWKDHKKNTFEYFCYHHNNYVDELCSYAREKLNIGETKCETVDYE